MKLNLGSRDRTIPGYKNMDCEAHDGVDFVGDVSDLSRFKDESIDEIYASHILEHFSHTRTVNVLKEWGRTLKKGGILRVAVPDFKRTVELYGRIGMCDWIENFLVGDQGYQTAFHYAIFDEQRLRKRVLDAGFSEASRVLDFGLHPTDCSTNVSYVDGKPVSLNLVCVR